MRRLALILVLAGSACLTSSLPIATAGTSPEVEEPVFHYVVEPGDTFWGIAAAHGAALTELATANPTHWGRDAHVLYPGDVLHIVNPECHRGTSHGSQQCTTTTTVTPSTSATSTSSPTTTAVATTVPTPTTTTPSTSSTSLPATSTSSVASTTSLATSTSSTSTSTTTSSTSTTVPAPTGNVVAVPLGQALPSEATCAGRVVSMTENRAATNTEQNATRGTSPNDENPRVTGNFVGTTDEILQWAACKWGINADWVRAQTAIESWWEQTAIGDNGESFGVLQVRRPFHATAFEDENAVRSTAYNADYAYSIWRRCFEGEYTWLNTVERGREYAAGDGMGCIGLWFSGRWYTDAAVGYMGRVSDYFNQRIWTTANFGPAQPDGGGPSTTTTPGTTSTSTTSSVPPSSTTTSTTSSTTTSTSTVPPTTGAWTQVAPSQVSMATSGSHFGFQSIAASGSTVYVTADYQGLWRSTNGGASWTKVSTDGDLESGTPWTLQVDPFNSQRLWANAGYGNGGPLLSTDGGATWTLRPVGAPTQSNDVYSIALDPNQQGHMLVAWHSPWTTGSAGITESFDGGQTWTNHPAGGPWGSGHAVWFVTSTTWIVGTQSNGIWRTTNSGDTWTQVSTLPITHGATGALTRVGSTLVLAAETRILQSTNGGASWTDISAGLPGDYYSAVASDGTYLYTSPSFPIAGDYWAATTWFRRPLSGGSWTSMATAPCYQGRCNGPRQVAVAGGTVFTVNYLGGVWRLS